MKLLGYEMDGESHIGILDAESIQRVAANSMMDMIAAGGRPAASHHRDRLEAVRLLPPLIPGKILAIGRNYLAHAKELNSTVPDQPLVFAVMPSAVIGSGDVIEWESSLTSQVDWEGELAVVIGKTARKVARVDALDYVFGYTAANDVSARDLQAKDKQWVRAKGLDTFCPLGPGIVTADEIPDPQNLNIITTVDGIEKQNGSTADMIFDVRFLIEYLSHAFTLHPGDMILTGTPAGVGKAQNPPQFLGDGSVVSVEIERIGKITNRCRML